MVFFVYYALVNVFLYTWQEEEERAGGRVAVYVCTCMPVSITDVQQRNCGALYPHAVSAKGVLKSREAEGSFHSSHLWEQEE